MASIHISSSYMIAAGAIWPPVCATAVALRFCTRKLQRAPLGIDDWLCLPALVAILGMGVTIITVTALKGFGYPTPIVEPSQTLSSISPQQRTTKIGYFVLNLLQILALACIKLSAVFFYRRVFRTGANKVVDIALLTVAAIVSIWGVGYFWAVIFLCGTQVSDLWGSVFEQLQCTGNTVAEQMSYAISDVLTDVIVMVFPIPLIWQLHMPTKNKLAVTGIFLLGTAAIAASIVRLVIFVQALSAEFALTSDQDLLSTAGAFCMMIEVGLGLCAVCLPSLSGTFKLKGVQTVLDGFRSIFSSRDHGSRTSLEQPYPQSTRSPSKYSTSCELQEPNLELHPIPSGGNIRVIKSVNVA